ncbi:MAG: class B sortase [Eubacterium sp.]|nr:class B sortase [Eubacterium sp.]
MKVQDKKQNRKRRIRRTMFLFFLSLLIVGVYVSYRYYREEKRQEEQFDELEEWENNPITFLAPANADWIGWLKIKDSSISYPVMQKEGDGEYYLHRDFDGNYSFCGTPFLDGRCTLDSDNCIIYGHNINGRRMFGALHAYDSEEYYKKHPEMYFRAGEEKRNYQIVSVIHADTSFPAYSFIDVGNWEEYRDYADMILSNSLYETELGKQMEKKRNEETAEQFFHKYQFLTLSTCRSWAGRDARLLVVAARERQNAE